MSGNGAQFLGYREKDAEGPVEAYVKSRIPETPAGAHASYCGEKEFVSVAIVHFDGDPGPIACARAAVVWFNDQGSPFHGHTELTELYVGIEGSGIMVLGEGADQIMFPFGPGMVVTIVPGLAHGLVADPGTSIKAFLTFEPYIAPPKHRRRDEYPVQSGILTGALVAQIRQ